MEKKNWNPAKVQVLQFAIALSCKSATQNRQNVPIRRNNARTGPDLRTSKQSLDPAIDMAFSTTLVTGVKLRLSFAARNPGYCNTGVRYRAIAGVDDDSFLLRSVLNWSRVSSLGLNISGLFPLVGSSLSLCATSPDFLVDYSIFASNYL